MCLLHVTNCCRMDLSENITRPQSSAVQVSCFLANARRLDFMTEVNRGLLAGLYDLRPYSNLSRRETVIELIYVPVWSTAARIFPQELVGERVTIRFIKWSSLRLVFLGRPHLFLSRKLPEVLKFTIAVCTAVLLQLTFTLICRSKYPSLNNVTILALLFSERDDFLPIFEALSDRCSGNTVLFQLYCKSWVNGGWCNSNALLHAMASFHLVWRNSEQQSQINPITADSLKLLLMTVYDSENYTLNGTL